MLQEIDRIEVIQGPGGTIWGPNAVDGVISIITRNAKYTQGTLASAAGGNEEQGLLGLRYGSGLAAGTDYRAYAKAFNRRRPSQACTTYGLNAKTDIDERDRILQDCMNRHRDLARNIGIASSCFERGSNVCLPLGAANAATGITVDWRHGPPSPQR